MFLKLQIGSIEISPFPKKVSVFTYVIWSESYE